MPSALREWTFVLALERIEWKSVFIVLDESEVSGFYSLPQKRLWFRCPGQRLVESHGAKIGGYEKLGALNSINLKDAIAVSRAIANRGLTKIPT